jgi:hypothetical protein
MLSQPAATVIVPWRHSPERERAWRWVKARHREKHPDWPVWLCGTSEGPWVKAKAVMPAVERAEDIVVVADADCWTDGLESAVRAVTVGAAEWAVPHRIVYRLTEQATDELILTNDYGGECERRPYEGVWGGGIVVAHRDTFLSVPFDPRFEGPGHEDEALGLALQTLCGQGWRGTADLIHLWHPRPTRHSTRIGSLKNWHFYKRYQDARAKPEQMKRLLEEFQREPRIPDEPQRDHHSPQPVG